MLEFRLGGTPGLYVLLTLAPSCETSTAIWGGKRVNSWCAQMGPGGRPSIGPLPPPSAGSTGCCVWLDCAVGAGTSVETAFRGSTSKRGIGCENFVMLNVGLGGRPVGTLSATASGANAHSPAAMTSIALNGFQGRCTVFLLVLLRTNTVHLPWKPFNAMLVIAAGLCAFAPEAVADSVPTGLPASPIPANMTKFSQPMP